MEPRLRKIHPHIQLAFCYDAHHMHTTTIRFMRKTKALSSNSSFVEYRGIVGGRNFKNLLIFIAPALEQSSNPSLV